MKWLVLLSLACLAVYTKAENAEAEAPVAEEEDEHLRVKRQYTGAPAQGYYLHDAMLNLAVVTSRAKPAAHIVGDVQASFHVAAPGALTFWRAQLANGGMKLERGTDLVVPAAGPYWCYAQIYFNTGRDMPKGPRGLPVVQPPSPRHQVDARFYLFVNGKTRMLSSEQPAVETSAYTGGLINLNAGDRLSVHVYTPNVKIWKGEDHTFFGCYLI